MHYVGSWHNSVLPQCPLSDRYQGRKAARHLCRGGRKTLADCARAASGASVDAER